MVSYSSRLPVHDLCPSTNAPHTILQKWATAVRSTQKKDTKRAAALRPPGIFEDERGKQMGTNDFDRRTALFLAAACGQTYTQFENSDGTFCVPRGYRVTSAFQAKLSNGLKERFGFILESDDCAVVAFRGTGSAVDWIADAIARQKKYAYVRDAGWAHEGFTTIYDSVRNQILPELNKLPASKTLYITGHSLGGALATLCAIDAAANAKCGPPRVYTFGSPRVGDPSFAKAYGRAIACSHRIYNVFDVVPQLPTLLYKSPKTGAVYQYMHVKNGYRLQFRNGSVSANHIISSYFAALAEQDPTYTQSMCRSNPGFCP